MVRSNGQDRRGFQTLTRSEFDQRGALALLCQIVLGLWCRARSLGGRRDAERAAAVRSRKARPAIPRGDFPTCDPRKPEYHQRISAPGTCRPHASVVAAVAEEYELGALSRRVERRRPPRLLVLRTRPIDSDLTKYSQTDRVGPHRDVTQRDSVCRPAVTAAWKSTAPEVTPQSIGGRCTKIQNEISVTLPKARDGWVRYTRSCPTCIAGRQPSRGSRYLRMCSSDT